MDNAKFTKHMQAFQKTVYRIAYSYVGNFEDAEDITQEAFIRLYTRDDDFKGDDNVKAWLIRVTVNLSKSHLRSAWIHRRENMPKSEIPCDNEREQALHEAISSLPPNYRAVIYLHYCEGYKVEELAKMLGTSASNIKARLSRGRAKLKDLMGEPEIM